MPVVDVVNLLQHLTPALDMNYGVEHMSILWASREGRHFNYFKVVLTTQSDGWIST